MALLPSSGTAPIALLPIPAAPAHARASLRTCSWDNENGETKSHLPGGSHAFAAVAQPHLLRDNQSMSGFHMPTPTQDEVRRGIAYMIVSVFIFAIVNALVKWLVADYPVTQVVFFR